jgi:uncharacterized protein YndB with AHSA1/START domain
MTTRCHTHEVVLPVRPEEAFRLLHTPSAIRGWWGVARAVVMPEEGGAWVAAWGAAEDDPDYITAATIRDFDPPRRLVLADYRYYAKTGPLPFRADFVVEFTVEPHAQGSRLRVRNDGFPTEAIADEFYAGCVRGWHDTFESLRKFVS